MIKRSQLCAIRLKTNIVTPRLVTGSIRSRSVACIVAVLFGTTSILSATTYYVNAPSYNSAIQGYVDLAQSGDTIVLRNGDHYLTSTITFNASKTGITIRGDSRTGTHVRKTTGGAAFLFGGNNNVLNRFDLDGGMHGDSGIIIFSDSNYMVDLSIHHNLNAGILIHQADHNRVHACDIYSNSGVGVSQSDSRWSDIQSCYLRYNGLEGITIDGTPGCPGGSAHCTVGNTWVYRNYGGIGGIGLDSSDYVTITGCLVDSSVGMSGLTIYCQYRNVTGITVQNSTFWSNGKWGIEVSQQGHALLNSSAPGCQFQGNAYGPFTIY